MQPKRAAVPLPSAPIVGRDEVKGFASQVEIPPNRYFYLLDTNDNVLWEADGYVVRDKDGRENWSINFICPVCGNNLRLDSTKKRIQVTENGLESDEPIQCSYGGDFGGLCRFRVELQPPRADKRLMDFRLPDGSMKQISVDALIRRC